MTASALLDLVSEDWAAKMIARCRETRAKTLFALSYDGRFRLSREDSFDATVRELVNEHQLRDKGFGPALGPDAAVQTERLLAAAGFAVNKASSDWQLRPRDARVQRAVVLGWADAARQVSASPALERWLARRLDEIDSGDLEIEVGHIDLLGH